MTYQLTRPAANASHSYRTAKIGRPHAKLQDALRAATEHARAHGDKVTVTDSRSGLWGSVCFFTYVGGAPTSGTSHFGLSLPAGWTEIMLAAGQWDRPKVAAP